MLRNLMPTQPQQSLIASLIANPPSASVRMDITPQLADEMLTYNINNRPLSDGTVQHYARQMKTGDWRYTRETIIFSSAGRLIDGQHRLTACARSGATISVDVSFGAPDESFAYIDIGKKRTGGDIFAIHGVQNGVAISAISKVVKQYCEGLIGSNNKQSVTPSELYDFFSDNPDIARGMDVYGHFKRSRLATPSVMAGLYVICARRNRSEADKFFEIVSEGFGAEKKTDPAMVLHNKLIEAVTKNMKLTNNALIGLTINCWNRMRDGHSGRGVSYDPEAKMPRVR